MLWLITPEWKKELIRFRADHPWTGEAGANWTLDKCFDGGPAPAYAALDTEENSMPHRFAIRTDREKEYRSLPDSLAALWLKGKLPAERLPKLLHGIEPQLVRSDYIRLSTMDPMQRGIRMWAFPVLGVVLLGGSLLTMSMREFDSSTSLFLFSLGALAIAVPLTIFGRLNSRRRSQKQWALSQASSKQASA